MCRKLKAGAFWHDIGDVVPIVLQTCRLRDTDVLYVRIGSARLVNVAVLEEQECPRGKA